MIICDGYSLTYEPKNNRIIIIMPQTMSTISNTVSMITNRRTNITSEEETMILLFIKAIMEKEE